MKALILGAGQLGRALEETVPNNLVIQTVKRTDCDFLHTEEEDFERLLTSAAPDVVINAAAWTDTSSAETSPLQAYQVNAVAPGLLAKACAKFDLDLIHISTDYVFDGRARQAYTENDLPLPLNEYGRGKLAGEYAIRANMPRHRIIRTSWVFAECGRNFVLTMLDLMQKRERLQVVHDQIGCPTYAGHLAQVVWQSLHIPYGVYHYADRPALSWFEFANSIAECAREQGMRLALRQIEPIRAADWSAPLQRPKRVILSTQKIAQQGIAVYHWRQGVQKIVAARTGRTS